jgi:ABC-type multidrug transport system fused ATPase/permease subunit
MAEVEIPNPEELHEQSENKFNKRIALVTAIYVVILAITSLGGSNAAKEMMLAQQEASNHWSHYQAKAIREHLYKSQSFLLKGLTNGKATGEALKSIQFLEEESARMGADKKEIEPKAKEAEETRDLNMKKDPYFDYAEVLLQIAVVLSSIAILSQAHIMFWMSLVTAIMGSVLSLNGYLLLFHIPGL